MFQLSENPHVEKLALTFSLSYSSALSKPARAESVLKVLGVETPPAVSISVLSF